jgi:hypothetical protein
VGSEHQLGQFRVLIPSENVKTKRSRELTAPLEMAQVDRYVVLFRLGALVNRKQ